MARALSQLHFLASYVMHSHPSVSVYLNFYHFQNILSIICNACVKANSEHILSQFHVLSSEPFWKKDLEDISVLFWKFLIFELEVKVHELKLNINEIRY